MYDATDFKHPPTPPAIPNDAVLTGSWQVIENVGVPPKQVYLLSEVPQEMPREPFDPHSMSIGAVSVAALLEDAA